MSDFRVLGLVSGGWPMTVDLQQEVPGRVSITLQIIGRKSPVGTWQLSEGPVGRQSTKFHLPQGLGDRVQPAYITVKATDEEGKRTLKSFKMYALGAGTRSIGSVAIDQISFHPSDIRLGRGERAAYRFYSHKDFDRVSVEFMRLLYDREGIHHQCICDQAIDNGVHGNQWIGRKPDRREWDGTDRNRQISTGFHKLGIRAWDQFHEGGWLINWSESSVNVCP